MEKIIFAIMFTAMGALVVRAFLSETVMEFIRRLIFAVFGSVALFFVTTLSLMAIG
jgi:hypothetical protein